MKILIKNEDGLIYVSTLFISLIIFSLLTSLTSILFNRNIAIESSNDSYRANYIVESILELKIVEIIDLCNEATYNYLEDLQIYNAEYVDNCNNISYNPPNFYNYISTIIPSIENLSASVNNPFEEYYKDEHSYNIDIMCSLNENYIYIKSGGKYNEARKFINVKLELPTVISNGTDEHGLPNNIILPTKVIQYYQTFGL